MKTIETPELRAALLAEAMQALRIGFGYAIVALLALGIILSTLLYLFGYPWVSFVPPLSLMFAILLVSLLLYFGIKHGVLGKAGVYACIITLACAPSVFFVATHFTSPGGAATFLHGPIVFGYFGILVFTGLFFEMRLSVLAGFAAALSYGIAYSFARPALLAFPISDPATYGAMVSTVSHTMKVVIILATGLFVGVVARYSRRILSRMLAEQKEKAEIDRLFGEYVSSEVKEKIKNNPLSNGERRTMAIMFTDLRGFTRLSEQNVPEEIVDRLNLYFDEMVAAIAAHGGVVDKFIGDAILATFGGILELEQPCVAAFKAAQEMDRRLDQLNANWAAVGLSPLRHGIGLHHAQVLQAVIGSRNRKDFTVIGDGVNLASRVESLTKKLGVSLLMTGEFYKELPEDFKQLVIARKRVKVRGRDAPLDVHASEFPDSPGSHRSIAGATPV